MNRGHYGVIVRHDVAGAVPDSVRVTVTGGRTPRDACEPGAPRSTSKRCVRERRQVTEAPVIGV